MINNGKLWEISLADLIKGLFRKRGAVAKQSKKRAGSDFFIKIR